MYYFEELPTAKTRMPIKRARFLGTDRDGLLEYNTIPIGISYYWDFNDIPEIPAGNYLKYYCVGLNGAQLEIAETISVNDLLTTDEEGRGVVATTTTGYAIALEGGDAGDLIRVQLLRVPVNDIPPANRAFNEAFSNAFE